MENRIKELIALFRPVDFEKWVEGWVDKLTQNRLTLLRAIHQNPRISKKEMAGKVSLIASYIDKNIDYLKNLGLLTRQGSAKSGHWKIEYLHGDGR